MTYYFQRIHNRYHVVFDKESTFALLDPFLQTEGPNFGDIILEAIHDLEKKGQEVTLSGNIYEISMKADQVHIEDLLGGQKETIPTSLFNPIFITWYRLFRAK